MLNKLIDVILQFIHQLMPVYVIQPYEEACHVRLGELKKTVGPGWYCKVPFLDTILKASVVKDVAVFNPQYISTLDGKTVAFKLVLTYSVRDIEAFLLEVEDAESSLADAAVGTVADLFATMDWESIRARGWQSALRTTLRRRAGEFGVRISRVQFASLASIRVYGLMHEA